MLFILEGVDKCGKSTLAKKLCKRYYAKLVKVNAPKTLKPFYEYVDLINSLSVKQNYVLDRFYLGEQAYGPVYRKQSRLLPEQQFYLEQLLLKFNPLLVYCWLDYNELSFNFLKDKENFTKIKDTPRLTRLFQDAFEHSILPKVKFNYKLCQAVNYVPSDNTLDLALSYLGRRKPKVLLVGDEPNYRLHLLRKVPYAVFNSVSGMFLMRTLMSSSLSFGLVNSAERPYLLTNRDLELINPHQVICLGRNAARRVCKLTNRYHTIVHPQYAKRFYGKDAHKRYLNEIMGVLT